MVNEKPYKRNLHTAAAFLIKEDKDFEKEKNRLVGYIQKTQHLGGQHFEGMQSHSFGALTQTGWNNGLYKHLDHHLSRFGV